MKDARRILAAAKRGDPLTAEELLPLVYSELRKLAAQKLAHERPGQTFEATALVHEAYVRLVDVKNAQRWNSRGHFFAAAAEAMRRILVENARKKRSRKRGGDHQRIDLNATATYSESPPDDLLSLDDALTELAKQDPVKADLVKLRYFAGLTVEQAADALGISRATADRYWGFAKVWLFLKISGKSSQPRE